MLSVRSISGGYGVSRILFDVSIEIARGEVVTLLGRNGMGKTTTVLSIMGILPIIAGQISLDETRIDGRESYQIARSGIGLVPEGRQVFSNLTVRENILVAASRASRGSVTWSYDSVLDLFPPLANRTASMAGLLSGGEQQMLAIARALVTNPHLLILDEATEGLSPLNRAIIWDVLVRLKNAGQSILVVDKHLEVLVEIADRHYVLEKGCIVWSGSSKQLRCNHETVSRYVGI